MPFSRPTLQEIIDRIEADFKNRIEEAGSSFLRRSVLIIMSKVYGAAVHLLYGYFAYLKDQLFATSADAENLETIANEFGISRNAGVKAVGTGEASGTAGFVIPISTKLQNAAGDQIYVTDEIYTVGVGGTISVDFTAEEEGVDGNDNGGITLTFVSPIAGITSTLTVDSAGISSGLDEESDDSLRARTLARKRQPPHGGAEFDYEAWALEISGVTRSWSFPQYQGNGTVGLAFVRDDDDSIIPDATEQAAVRSYIVSHTDPLTGIEIGIPVTAEPGFFIIDVSLQSLNFSIGITPNNATVQSEIESALEDLILNSGGPGDTIYLSSISAAISSSASEIAHSIILPAADIAIPTNKVGVLGTITWSNY